MIDDWARALEKNAADGGRGFVGRAGWQHRHEQATTLAEKGKQVQA